MSLTRDEGGLVARRCGASCARAEGLHDTEGGRLSRAFVGWWPGGASCRIVGSVGSGEGDSERLNTWRSVGREGDW